MISYKGKENKEAVVYVYRRKKSARKEGITGVNKILRKGKCIEMGRKATPNNVLTKSGTTLNHFLDIMLPLFLCCMSLCSMYPIF
jgi:hypothetical protein